MDGEKGPVFFWSHCAVEEGADGQAVEAVQAGIGVRQSGRPVLPRPDPDIDGNRLLRPDRTGTSRIQADESNRLAANQVRHHSYHLLL